MTQGLAGVCSVNQPWINKGRKNMGKKKGFILSLHLKMQHYKFCFYLHNSSSHTPVNTHIQMQAYTETQAWLQIAVLISNALMKVTAASAWAVLTTSWPHTRQHRKDFKQCLRLTAGLYTYRCFCTSNTCTLIYRSTRPCPTADFREGGKEGGPDKDLTHAQAQY